MSVETAWVSNFQVHFSFSGYTPWEHDGTRKGLTLSEAPVWWKAARSVIWDRSLTSSNDVRLEGDITAFVRKSFVISSLWTQPKYLLFQSSRDEDNFTWQGEEWSVKAVKELILRSRKAALPVLSQDRKPSHMPSELCLKQCWTSNKSMRPWSGNVGSTKQVPQMVEWNCGFKKK